jgi:hypothetical protein
MLYTATIVMCLIGKEASYKNCDIMNAEFKYPTEELCQKILGSKIVLLQERSDLLDTYEIVDVKCTQWIPKGLNL